MGSLLLNAEDLAKVQLGTSWGPFTETLLSLHALRSRRPSALLDGWAESVRGELGPETALLYALTRTDPLLDLHTVVGPASSIGEALERLERAPDEQLRRELDVLRPSLERSEPWARAWVRDLSDGDRRARRELVTRLDDYHKHAVGPYWDTMRRHLEAEAAHRARIMADGGVDRLLATLHPGVRWRPPRLDIGPNARTGCPGGNGHRGVQPRLHVPDGRSLVLVPAVFDLHEPYLLWSTADETLPYVLLYPALRDIDDARSLWSASGPSHRALEMLVGRTRARALEAIADTCTTTELARRIGVSLPTASHHVGVMRDAGLVASHRTGSNVLHYVTARGAALLQD
jgi:DNA-binding transcriptional ArsR family regulator